MAERLPHHLAQRAEAAHLGRYLGSLTPPWARSLRTVVVGITVAGFVLIAWVTVRHDSWLLTVALVIVGAAAIAAVGVGVVELLPGPGRMLLFEKGFIHVHPDGEVDALEYGGAPRGDELRARARGMMSDGM